MNEVTGCCGDAARRDRRKRRDGHRHALAEPRLCGHAFGRSQLRVRQRPRVCVGLDQAVVETRHAGDEHVGRRQVTEVVERQALLVDVDRAVDAGRRRAGRRDLKPEIAQPLPVHFEELDVDHHLRPGLVDGGEDARRRRDAVRRVLDCDRVGRRQAGDSPKIDDDAKEVDGFLEIGVAQVEGANDLVFVFAPLRGRVGNDGDGPRRGDLVEVARARRDRGQRVLEADVAQLGGDRRLAERRDRTRRSGCRIAPASR